MIAVGTHLGPYEILTLVGAGGMGEVYRARDTRLDRTVAIKVLPATLSSDTQFRERFDREARAISQLDHPHICTLYDVGDHAGTSFLVMQYLEGETLEQRLKKGALPLDQALQYAIHIAEALDKAHRAGIVHRDLKPGNIMLTKTGATLLDFGLSKASPVIATASLSMLPTTPPAAMTAHGTILGTFQYMAPEQLEGREADARTDIFAFGTVVYEMVTGKKAFVGTSHASLISAIMSAQPALMASVQPIAPLVLDHLVATCLAKDPDGRWQSAADIVRELTWIASPEGRAPSAVPATALTQAPPHRPGWLPWSVAGTMTAIAVAFAALYIRAPAPAAPVVRFTVLPGKDVTLDVRTLTHAISPDGRRLAFVAVAGGDVQIWVRPIDAVEAQPLRGTEGTTGGIFWSPDSRFIGFFAGGKLKKIDVAGGPALTLANAPTAFGAAWGPDGNIVLGNAAGPLARVSADGGDLSPLTTLDAGRKESTHRTPTFLPDGRHLLYLAQSPNTIYVSSLDGKDRKRLISADTFARYSAGHLLFVRQATLMAQAFDLRKLDVVGEPFVVAQPIQASAAFGTGTFSVSDNGVLTYRSGGDFRTQLTWFDRSGKMVGQVGRPADYEGLDLSPDGERIVLHRHENQTGNLWLFEWKRDVNTRLTFLSDAHDVSPIWSPDGRQIAFASTRGSEVELLEKASTGAGGELTLLKSPDAKRPTDWSRDGRFLVYEQGNAPMRDVWILPMTGDKRPYPFLNTSFDEARAQLSPDNRWMVYVSNESGSHQVYVQPFPATGAKWQISTSGGSHPRWRSNGKELFYMTSDGTITAVSIDAAGETLSPGRPSQLFRIRPTAAEGPAGLWHPYAVSADGQRFLVIENIDDATASPITVVLNWFEELKQRVPIK